jgi:hypothetical protein
MISLSYIELDELNGTETPGDRFASEVADWCVEGLSRFAF